MSLQRNEKNNGVARRNPEKKLTKKKTQEKVKEPSTKKQPSPPTATRTFSDALLLLFAWRHSPFFSNVPVEVVDEVRVFLVPSATRSAKNSVAKPALLQEHLGKEIGRLKRDVVETVCRGPVSFNKYPGFLELQNALVLFINVGGAEYENKFEEGGRRISWWFPPSMHNSHPLVVRALGDPRLHLLLFCRPVNEPYVYMGRLRLLGASVPPVGSVRMDLELSDFKHSCLRESPGFQKIVCGEEM